MIDANERLAALRRRTQVAYQAGTRRRWAACLSASRIVGQYTRGATAALADDLAIGVDQVENLARAGRMYRRLRRYTVIGEHVERFADLTAILSPSHFDAIGGYVESEKLSDAEALDALVTAADHRASVKKLNQFLRDAYGDPPDPHEWQAKVRRLECLMSDMLADPSTPAVIRRRIDRYYCARVGPTRRKRRKPWN